MQFNINHLTPVLFGEGVSQQTGSTLKDHGVNKVFCVYDKGLKATGIPDRIIKNIKDNDIEVVEYDCVLPDPPVEAVDDAGEAAKKEKVDAVLGIGGGSSLDTAKAVNVLLGNPGSIKNYLKMDVNQAPGKFLYAIPTNAGTGSEVTGIAVISDKEAGMKMGVAGPNCTARLAIIDPELMLCLPPGLTASSGMDAFSHAIEAYTSAMNNPMSDILALKAISIIVKYLPVAVKDGSNIKARSKLSFASMIAGMSFNNSPPHLGHAIAHSLGVLHNVPHGVGCGLSVPSVVEYLSDVVPERIRDIGAAMGLSLEEDLNSENTGVFVADAIRNMNREIGLPKFSSLSVTEDDLLKIAQEATRDLCWFLIPKSTSEEDTLKLIQNEYFLD